MPTLKVLSEEKSQPNADTPQQAGEQEQQAKGQPILQVSRMTDGSFEIDAAPGMHPPAIFAVLMDIMPVIWKESRKFAQSNKSPIVKPNSGIINHVRNRFRR